MLDPLDQAACTALMSEWQGQQMHIQRLTGGITNTLYRVTLGSGGDYVVRCYGEGTELFIDRDVEMENIRLMTASGVTPRLVRYLPEQRVTVVEFVPGRTLGNADFLDPAMLARAVEPIRRIHATPVTLPRVFSPLAEVRKLHRLYRERCDRHPELDWEDTLEELARLDAIAAIDPASYVPCHNDLLADNFILVDDPEQRGNEIFVIDWEYAGMSTPYYDLADMLQELLLPAAVEQDLLRLYFGAEDLQRHQQLVELHRPFPDIYWALWSYIQLEVSAIDFDYASYGRSKYDNARANLKKL